MEPAAQPLWTPSPERARKAALTRFSHYVQERYKAPIHDYASLHKWSVEFPENFWNAVWDFCEIRCSRNAQQTIQDATRVPDARWFVGALLNYAENLLPVGDDSIALIFRNEAGERRQLTRHQLRSEVARVADGLKRAGVKVGDRVAGELPNIPEAVIAMLATISVGAIWSSRSTDVGQVKPRVLFAAYGAPVIAGIECVVLVPYPDKDAKADQLPHGVLFNEFGRPDQPLTFAQLPFEQPAFILGSSVHSGGGTLLQQMKENILHLDMRAEDRCFYSSTCDWFSGLATGATLVLFDGTDPNTIWRIAAEERVTIFGTDSKFLTTCEQQGLRPREELDLSALKTVISTGAPLSPAGYRYVYRHVHPDVQLSAITGGSLGTGCPILPVYEGEVQALGLGMKVEVFDDAGKPLTCLCGELVCTQPFPSVPLSAADDAQLSRYPNVWSHGDRATLTSRRGLIVHNRL